MIVRNLDQLALEFVTAHSGIGKIRFSRPFESNDFDSSWHFVDFVIIPPGASIGIHQHGTNEEMYFMLSGHGTMTVNDEERSVRKGDLILNKPGWSHGLRNDGTGDIKVLVIEVGVNEGSDA